MEAELTEEERRKEALRKAGQEYFENVLKKAAVGRDPFAPAPSSSPSRLALGTSHHALPASRARSRFSCKPGGMAAADGDSDSSASRLLLCDDEAVPPFALRGLSQPTTIVHHIATQHWPEAARSES
jgi:hypothetical protein